MSDHTYFVLMTEAVFRFKAGMASLAPHLADKLPELTAGLCVRQVAARRHFSAGSSNRNTGRRKWAAQGR